MATTALARKTAPEVGGMAPRNRAWDFFGESVRRTWEIDPQVVEGHLEKTTTDPKTASGVPYWPNRDPIGERGGTNLYGFTLNNPVNWIDSDGRATIIPNEGGGPTSTNIPGSQPTDPGNPFDVPNVNDPPSPPPTPENFPPQGPKPFENGDGSNCYSFACNRPYDPFDNWPPRNWIPGQGSFGTTQFMSCDELVRRVKADGGIEPGDDGCCPYGYHKIRPFVEPVWGWNFHFYRQDADGGWGEKPGAQRPNRVDDPNVYNGPTRPLVYLRRMLEGEIPANILDYWDRVGLDFVPYERCPDLCVPD